MYDVLNTGLVFTDSKNEKAEPFTTNLVIADFAVIKVKAINQLINKYKDELGVSPFQMEKISNESNNGRPILIYNLNEKQSIFLISLLKNTKPVVEFKRKLADAFVDTTKLLKQRQLIHEQSKPVSIELGQAIKDNTIIDSKHAYSNFNRLIYKTALGMNTNKLRLNKGISAKAVLTDYLTIDEQKQLNKVKQLVISLLQMDYSYQDIKNVVINMPQKQLQVS